MDEEDEILDHRSPKGQLIKLLEQKCKKPEIDNSLSEILDKFLKFINDDDKYLKQGIFTLNFAENAILLQHCTLYYAKRVDKLWDELLHFHTNLIKCDTRTYNVQKQSARNKEITDLEERINRNRRKKITLLETATSETTAHQSIFGRAHSIMDSLFGTDPVENVNNAVPFELDEELRKSWKAIKNKKKESRVVQQYCTQTYRLKNYPIAGDNPIIYDMEDPEEFNTRQSRLVSYHHIRHLLEYNDRCLLPDSNHTIAKLRFAYFDRIKFVMKHNIAADTPYEAYKEDYEKYIRNYMAKEGKKIQNMPQNNVEDLRKLYKVLQEKEEEALQAQKKLLQTSNSPSQSVTFDTLFVDPLWKDNSMEYADIPEDSTEDIHFREGDDLDEIFSKACRKAIDDKSRSDSGYFDEGFETDDSDAAENAEAAPQEITLSNVENVVEQTNENNDNDVSTMDNIISATDNDASATDNGVSATDNSVSTTDNGVSTTDNGVSATDNGVSATDNDVSATSNDISAMVSSDAFITTTLEAEANDISVIGEPPSEVEDCVEEREKIEHILRTFFSEHDYVKQTDDMIMVVYNKSVHEEETHKGSEAKGVKEKGEKSAVKRKEPQEKKVNAERDDKTPAKRRKLTEKQIIRLKTSLINPVKELKFESFFSMNYQAEADEGEVIRCDYESELDSDTESITSTANYSSDFEGSHNSDHNYCRSPHSVGEELQPVNEEEPVAPPREGPQNDSGLFEMCDINILAHLDNRESTVNPPVATPEPKSNLDKERDRIRDSVVEWKSFIAPKLKKLDEQDFDIHDYGSKILDSLTFDENKPFRDLVQDKSSAEVVRCFISTLQLANTYNVEICGVQPGELSNNTLQLKLLSRERHHEHLVEYQAPSEEHFRDKLEMMREIRQQTKKGSPMGTSGKTTASARIGNKNVLPVKKIKIVATRFVNDINCQEQQPSTSRGDYLQEQQISRPSCSYSTFSHHFESNVHLQSTPRTTYTCKKARTTND